MTVPGLSLTYWVTWIVSRMKDTGEQNPGSELLRGRASVLFTHSMWWKLLLSWTHKGLSGSEPPKDPNYNHFSLQRAPEPNESHRSHHLFKNVTQMHLMVISQTLQTHIPVTHHCHYATWTSHSFPSNDIFLEIHRLSTTNNELIPFLRSG